MRTLYDNHILNATITSSTEETGYEWDTALNDSRLSRYGRTTSKTTQWLKFAFGAAVDMTYIAILAHNFTNSATIVLEGNATDSWGSPSFQETLTIADTIISNYTLSSYKYWRITMTDPSNTNDYLQIGNVFLGEHLQWPGMLPTQALPISSTSLGQKSQTRQLYGDIGILYNTARISFPVIDFDEYTNINTFIIAMDIITPFILLLWESDLDEYPPLYCNLIAPPEWQKLPTQGVLYTVSFEYEECF